MIQGKNIQNLKRKTSENIIELKHIKKIRKKLKLQMKLPNPQSKKKKKKKSDLYKIKLYIKLI